MYNEFIFTIHYSILFYQVNVCMHVCIFINLLYWEWSVLPWNDCAFFSMIEMFNVTFFFNCIIKCTSFAALQFCLLLIFLSDIWNSIIQRIKYMKSLQHVKNLKTSFNWLVLHFLIWIKRFLKLCLERRL